MATTRHTFSGTVTAPLFNGPANSAATLTGNLTGDVTSVGMTTTLGTVSRSKLASGTANYVLINDAQGSVSEEQFLGVTRGGLGANLSSTAGLIKSSGSGSYSSSSIVNSDISTTAEIGRAKLANGTANYVVINGSDGDLAEEQYLALVRGGLGANYSSSTGVLKATGSGYGVSLIVNADVSSSAAITDTKLATISTSGKVANSATTATTAATPSTIALRDVSSGLTMVNATMNNFSIVPATGTLNTTDATPGTLISFTTTTNTSYFFTAQVACTSTTSGTDSAAMELSVKAKNVNGTLTISSVAYTTSIVDNPLNGVAADFSISGTNLILTVTGLAATNLKWNGVLTAIKQAF